MSTNGSIKEFESQNLSISNIKFGNYVSVYIVALSHNFSPYKFQICKLVFIR